MPFIPIIGSSFDADAAQSAGYAGLNADIERQNINSQAEAMRQRNDYLSQVAQMRQQAADRAAQNQIQQQQFGANLAESAREANQATGVKLTQIDAGLAADKQDQAAKTAQDNFNQAQQAIQNDTEGSVDLSTYDLPSNLQAQAAAMLDSHNRQLLNQWKQSKNAADLMNHNQALDDAIDSLDTQFKANPTDPNYLSQKTALSKQKPPPSILPDPKTLSALGVEFDEKKRQYTAPELGDSLQKLLANVSRPMNQLTGASPTGSSTPPWVGSGTGQPGGSTPSPAILPPLPTAGTTPAGNRFRIIGNTVTPTQPPPGQPAFIPRPSQPMAAPPPQTNSPPPFIPRPMNRARVPLPQQQPNVFQRNNASVAQTQAEDAEMQKTLALVNQLKQQIPQMAYSQPQVAAQLKQKLQSAQARLNWLGTPPPNRTGNPPPPVVSSWF